MLYDNDFVVRDSPVQDMKSHSKYLLKILWEDPNLDANVFHYLLVYFNKIAKNGHSLLYKNTFIHYQSSTAKNLISYLNKIGTEIPS